MHYWVATLLRPDLGSLEATVAIRVPAASAAGGVGFLLGRDYEVKAISAGPNGQVTLTDVIKPFPAQRMEVRSRGRAMATSPCA